jgi:glycosyltransferase involved in cell wall biosynthesis
MPERVLVVFNSVCLYGMERSVIETFEVLKPDVEPIFLTVRANQRHRTPLLAEIERSGFPIRFFGDQRDWPRFGKPRSFGQAMEMLSALIRGNLDVLRASRGADALYLPIVTSAFLAVLAALWFRLRGKKIIYFFHDLPVTYSTKLRPAVALSTDLVHYAKRSLDMAAAANPFVLGRRNTVIPPAIRMRESGAGYTQSGGRNIVFAGQIAPHKGVDLLIEAFSALAGKYPDIRLILAGGVYRENQAWFDAALQRCAHRGRIHCLGYQNQIHEVLKNAYVLAVPTRPSRFHESFGRVAAEAMAVGVPTVCFKSGALEEVVADRETGLVCEVESAQCLAAKLEEFICQPEWRDLCGRNASVRYQHFYAEPLVRRDWLNLLRQNA